MMYNDWYNDLDIIALLYCFKLITGKHIRKDKDFFEDHFVNGKGLKFIDINS